MSAKITPTRGESLVLWRRRKGLTQPSASHHFKVSPSTYRLWEADRPTPMCQQPSRRLGALKMHEVCFILRRRASMTQTELAGRLGLSVMWVKSMEAGKAPIERLREFWGV